MEHGTAANWRLACLLTLGAFLGLSVAAFATGLLPGDLALRQEIVAQDAGLTQRGLTALLELNHEESLVNRVAEPIDDFGAVKIQAHRG